jgi:hypothetical protein
MTEQCLKVVQSELLKTLTILSRKGRECRNSNSKLPKKVLLHSDQIWPKIFEFFNMKLRFTHELGAEAQAKVCKSQHIVVLEINCLIFAE